MQGRLHALQVSPGLALREVVLVHDVQGQVVQGRPGHLLRHPRGSLLQGGLLIANVVHEAKGQIKANIAKVVYSQIRLKKHSKNINSKESNLNSQ